MNKPLIPELVQKLALFDQIHIQHPRMQNIHGTFDHMREIGRSQQGQRKRHRGLRILGPSFSGKTRSIESYRAANGMGREDFTVLHVELQQNATPKRLWIDILTAFGDGFATLGSEEIVKRRAQQYFEQLKVELIIFDEVQQLLRRGSTARAWSISEALKRLLDEGYAPIVFVGTLEALPIFTSNPQINNRLLPPIDLTPLDATVKEDRMLFCGYCGLLDERMVQLGCVEQCANLMDPHILSGLYLVSGGVVGVVSNLLRHAMETAYRNDRQHIWISDLEFAVDRWAISGGICQTNPFAGKDKTKSSGPDPWEL